jgi:hypothetical protein
MFLIVLHLSTSYLNGLQDYQAHHHHQYHIIAASQADYSADISMFQSCHTGHTQQFYDVRELRVVPMTLHRTSAAACLICHLERFGDLGFALLVAVCAPPKPSGTSSVLLPRPSTVTTVNRAGAWCGVPKWFP